MMRFHASFLVLLLVLLSTPVLQAPIIATNEPQPGGNASFTFSEDATTRTLAAQSFTTTATYRADAVELNVASNGGSPADLSGAIWTDASGRPGAVLASGLSLIDTNRAWYLLPFTASVILPPARYWVVLSPATDPSSFRWFLGNSGNDNLTEGNWQRNDTKVPVPMTGSWELTDRANRELAYRVIGESSTTAVTAGLKVFPPSVKTGATVTYTVYFNNTGSTDAGTVWTNLTVAPEFQIEWDTNATEGGAYLAPGSWRFSPVVPGAHSFDVVARLTASPPPGTVLLATLLVEYTDSFGVKGPILEATAAVAVALEWKQLYLYGGDTLRPPPPSGGGLNVTLVESGGPAQREHLWTMASAAATPLRLDGRVSVILFLEDDQVPASHTVTFSLLWAGNLTPIDSITRSVALDPLPGPQSYQADFSPPGQTIAAGERLALRIRNEGGAGQDLYVHYGGSAVPSHLNLQTSSYIRIDSLTVRDLVGPGVSFTTLDPLTVVARISDPFNATEIANAQLTVANGTATLPPVSPTILTDPATPPAWKEYRWSLGVLTGLGPYDVTVVAFEGNSVSQAAVTAFAIVSPVMTLSKRVNATVANGGESLQYTIWINNTGNAVADRVWVNDTLPANVTYVSSSIVPSWSLAPFYGWNFTNVVPGSNSFTVTVLIDPGLLLGVLLNTATLDYAGSDGTTYPTETSEARTTVNSPLMEVTKSVDLVDPYPGASVRYTITIVNTGTRNATNVVIVDTLPGAVSYVASSSGGVPGAGAVTWIPGTEFSPNGTDTRTYTVDVLVPDTVPSGSVLTNTVVVSYRHPSGVPLPDSTGSVTTVVKVPVLTLSASGSPLFAESTQVVSYDLVVRNQGLAPAATTWVNVSVPAELVFVNASCGPCYNPFLRQVSWTLPPIAPGASAFLWANLTVAPGVQDGFSATLTARLNHTGPVAARVIGNATANPVSVLFLAPSLRLEGRVDPVGVDGGSTFTATLYFNNTGNAATAVAWLNLTLPPGLTLLGASQVNTTLLGWRLTDVPVGNLEASHTLTLVLRAGPDLADGHRLDLLGSLQFSDRGWVVTSLPAVSVTQWIRAPRIVSTLIAVAGTNPDLVTFEIVLMNNGSRPAGTVWVNTTIPASARHLGDGFPGLVVVNGQNLTWVLTPVDPGNATYSLSLNVSGARGETFALFVTTESTNALGLGSAFHKSNTLLVDVPVRPPPGDGLPPFPWQPFLLVLLVLAAGIFVVYRRMLPHIEEMFLVHRNGTLIHHLSPSESTKRDPDIVSGMLTAVQDFVHDAFVYGDKKRALKKMDFGEYSIVIRRGEHLYFAAVIRGRDTPRLREMMEGALFEIEDKFGKELKEWEGDEATLVPVREFLAKKFKGKAGEG